MAKTTGPLFSLRARGQIADTLVYARWRGVPYVRTHVIPSNPDSTAQQEVRNIFRSLNAMWLRSPQLMRDPWVANATGQPFTDRNVLIRENVVPLQGETDLLNLVLSPGSGGAVPPDSVVPSDGGGQVLTLTAVQPTLPVGWTHVAFVGVAVLDGDFSLNIVRTPIAAEDVATPFTIALISVGTAGTYAWSGFNELLAPDLTTRYSVGISGALQVIA